MPKRQHSKLNGEDSSQAVTEGTMMKKITQENDVTNPSNIMSIEAALPRGDANQTAQMDSEIGESGGDDQRCKRVSLFYTIERIMRGFGDGSPYDCLNIHRNASVKIVEKYVSRHSINIFLGSCKVARAESKDKVDLIHVLQALRDSKYLLACVRDFLKFEDLKNGCTSNSSIDLEAPRCLYTQSITELKSRNETEIIHHMETSNCTESVHQKRLKRFHMLSLLMTELEHQQFVSDRSISFLNCDDKDETSGTPHLYKTWLGVGFTKEDPGLGCSSSALKALAHVSKCIIGVVIDRVINNRARSYTTNMSEQFQRLLCIEQRLRKCTSVTPEVKDAVGHNECSLYVGGSAQPNEIKAAISRK